MTPKEKAKHILWEYLPILEGWKELDSFKAKQCALIAVDEILLLLPLANRDFWQEVKQELQNLN